MTKDNWLQIFVAVLLIALVLAFAAGQATANTLYTQIAAAIGAVLVLAAIALGAERGTELLKIVLRFIFGYIPFLKSWQPSGAGSVLIAFLVSYAGVNKFNPDILNQFPQFANVDPQLVSFLTMALVWIGSSIWHNALPATAGRAQAVK